MKSLVIMVRGGRSLRIEKEAPGKVRVTVSGSVFGDKVTVHRGTVAGAERFFIEEGWKLERSVDPSFV